MAWPGLVAASLLYGCCRNCQGPTGSSAKVTNSDPAKADLLCEFHGSVLKKHSERRAVELACVRVACWTGREDGPG
jgi:hypothetical protein